MSELFETRRWLPVDAPLRGRIGARTPEVLRLIVKQFDVERNPRYARSVGATWCNIFLWDVTRALCPPIDLDKPVGEAVPHWIEVARILTGEIVDTEHEGDPCELPSPSQAHEDWAPRIKRIELTANGQVDWLERHGARFGWSPVERPMAADLANAGQPVAVVWANKTVTGKDAGPGHVAICLPPVDGQIRIAQAGGSNFYDEPLERGFARLPVKFFAHA